MGTEVTIGMRPRVWVAAAIAVTALVGVQRSAAGQHLVEVRLADTEYCYVDWNYTCAQGAVVDVFYVGVPGSNELNVGGGYAIRRGRLTLTAPSQPDPGQNMNGPRWH